MNKTRKLTEGELRYVDLYMSTPIKNWPSGLKDFVDYQQKRLGMCTEVIRHAIETFVVEVTDHWEDDNFRNELLRRDEEVYELRSKLQSIISQESTLRRLLEDQVIELKATLEDLRRGQNGCWCEVANDNPMFGGRHTDACNRAVASIRLNKTGTREEEQAIADAEIKADVCLSVEDAQRIQALSFSPTNYAEIAAVIKSERLWCIRQVQKAFSSDTLTHSRSEKESEIIRLISNGRQTI